MDRIEAIRSKLNKWADQYNTKGVKPETDDDIGDVAADCRCLLSAIDKLQKEVDEWKEAYQILMDSHGDLEDEVRKDIIDGNL